MKLELTINGKDYSFDAELTGSELLKELEIVPSTVVVELNREIVRREDFLERRLASGDSLELVTIVGGG
ncbi:MAG TPA: sulfur carrier protein ThiS [Firmicutes bacterium]|mgnify:CR=1 FL=1|nr:sulfur carrier protein ThiS [Bacillota bacterium]